MKLQAQLRFKHGIIMEILEKYGITIKQLSTMCGWNYNSLVQFIGLRVNAGQGPNNRDKLFQVLYKMEPGITYEDIFPENLKTAVEVFGHTRKSIKDIPIDRMLQYNNSIPLEQKSHENEILEEVDKEIFYEALNSLPPRNQMVLRMIYGIGYDREYTLREIGEKINRTQELVRRIRNKSQKMIWQYIYEHRSSFIYDLYNDCDYRRLFHLIKDKYGVAEAHKLGLNYY